MSTVPDPYVNTSPGDLITAQLFNGLQVQIKQDIADQIQKAVDGIKRVDQSEDAGKLGGRTPEELEREIIDKALAILPSRTGYKMLFKRLTKDREKVVEHKLKACPLVDIYALDYFPVICATGDDPADRADARVNFYLYHSKENKFRSITTPANIFTIEPTDGKTHPFRIPFSKMLDLFHVTYTDTQSLGDLETEFWKALFQDPNDEFDEDQYCHSPWFEKCCGESRSVSTLKSRGDWNELMFQMRPSKVEHFPASPAPVPPPPIPALDPLAGPLADVQVVHFDFDTLGLRLLADPTYPNPLTPPEPPITNPKELKVMLLLKV